jgi:hypothetical protein
MRKNLNARGTICAPGRMHICFLNSGIKCLVRQTGEQHRSNTQGSYVYTGMYLHTLVILNLILLQDLPSTIDLVKYSKNLSTKLTLRMETCGEILQKGKILPAI